MKTRSNGSAEPSSAASASSRSRERPGMRSTLFRMAMRLVEARFSRSRIASSSRARRPPGARPRRAITAPGRLDHGRSSRRRGRKMPGVSMKMSWLSPAEAMPRTGMRVVCTLCETIEFGADERVEERRLARVRRAEDRDEAAAAARSPRPRSAALVCLVISHRRAPRAPLAREQRSPPLAPRRAWRRPPRAGRIPAMRTSEVKSGA